TAVFKAHQIMTPILWLTLIGQIVLFAGTLILLLARQPLFTLILWHGITLSLQCLLAAIFYKKRIAFRSKPVHDEPAALKNTITSTRPAADAQNSASVMTGSGISKILVKSLILSAWPFALAGFLAALQMRANVLILAYIAGDQALGWYAAANRFVETGKQLPGAFYVAILPALAAMAGDISRRPNLRKTFRQAQLGLLAFALLASLGALLLAQPVLTLTYGPAYQSATLTLQILTLSLIPTTQNSLAIVYLYARGDEKFVNVLMTVGIVVNLSLCFLLIPTWGPAGTAIALLMAESVLY
ncbi:MAG: oligosaccharide flippase family protein, partial [Chloroflexi bacterium]|nr:oligosaccharide flippase family protein [Chloroflexota bacterium]